MNLLLAEMLSPVIAELLRARGHDVEAIKAHPQHHGLSDSEVMDLARYQRRAVATNNVVDFRVLHHALIAPGQPGHFGVIFLPGRYRRTKSDIGRIVNALASVLIQHPGDADLAGGEVWI